MLSRKWIFRNKRSGQVRTIWGWFWICEVRRRLKILICHRWVAEVKERWVGMVDHRDGREMRVGCRWSRRQWGCPARWWWWCSWDWWCESGKESMSHATKVRRLLEKGRDLGKSLESINMLLDQYTVYLFLFVKNKKPIIIFYIIHIGQVISVLINF